MAKQLKLRKYLPKRGSRMVHASLFVVTFDEYSVVDTIEQDGKLLISTNQHAKVILRNADKMLCGIAPVGFTWAN